MKKSVIILLIIVLALSAAACTQNAEPAENSQTESVTEKATEAFEATVNEKIKSDLDAVMQEYEFEGAAYLTQNGQIVYEYANGKDVNDADITTKTPLPIGSVSKQFCAAAIVALRDGGKLSLDDKLDKYFPEYAEGRRLTIRNLLTMRSGIPDVVNEGDISAITDPTAYDDNRKFVLDTIFGLSLKTEPDRIYDYSNSNYILLSAIVENVSGQKYSDYLRSVFLEPFGMSNTGSLDELQGAAPEWAEGLSYSYPAGVSTGAGDIVSTAQDMDRWLTGLRSGAVISDESYKEMTTDYSTDSATGYGYGFMLDYKKGVGHPGSILIGDTPYCAFDYISEENGYDLIIEGSDLMPGDLEGLYHDVIDKIV